MNKDTMNHLWETRGIFSSDFLVGWVDSSPPFGFDIDIDRDWFFMYCMV
jgi:hypothetical protein